MVTFEQVEKLRQKTNISYEEAKKALEETNGDLLEAVINLERQNRIQPPKSGGYYNSKEETSREKEVNSKEKTSTRKEKTTLGENITSFFKWLGNIIHKGNINNFEVIKDGQRIMMLPLTALALLLLFAFWVIIPLVIIGLVFGYRFQFTGPDLERTSANQAMSKVSDVTLKAVDSVFDTAEYRSGESRKKQGEKDGADSDN